MNHSTCGIVIFLLCLDYFVVSKDVKSNALEDNQCESGSEVECIKINLVSNLDKIVRQRNFQLFSGLELQQIPGTERLNSGRSLSANELESLLPEDAEKREEQLDNILEQKVTSLLDSKSLKLSLENVFPGAGVLISKSNGEKYGLNVNILYPEGGRSAGEGRIKGMKKLLPLGALFLYSAMMMGALALTGIAGIAGKALLIGKLALLLSGIIGLKKLSSQHHESYAYQNAGYGKSIEDKTAQGRAYRGQKA